MRVFPLTVTVALLASGVAFAEVSAVVQKPTVDVHAEPRLDAPKVSTLTRGTASESLGRRLGI